MSHSQTVTKHRKEKSSGHRLTLSFLKSLTSCPSMLLQKNKLRAHSLSPRSFLGRLRLGLASGLLQRGLNLGLETSQCQGEAHSSGWGWVGVSGEGGAQPAVLGLGPGLSGQLSQAGKRNQQREMMTEPGSQRLGGQEGNWTSPGLCGCKSSCLSNPETLQSHIPGLGSFHFLKGSDKLFSSSPFISLYGKNIQFWRLTAFQSLVTSTAHLGTACAPCLSSSRTFKPLKTQPTCSNPHHGPMHKNRQSHLGKCTLASHWTKPESFFFGSADIGSYFGYKIYFTSMSNCVSFLPKSITVPRWGIFPASSRVR